MKKIIILNRLCVGDEEKMIARQLVDKNKKFFPASHLYFVNEPFLYLPFYENSPEYAEALEEVKEKSQGFIPDRDTIRTVVYTKKELEQVEFFYIDLPEPMYMEGRTVLYYGTKYEWECPECGVLKNLDGNIKIDRKYLNRCHFGLLNPECYVWEETKELLESSHLTGVKCC